MTGFGRGSASGDGFEISVELNSVNRRNLETSFSLPKDWQILERPLAEALRTAFGRGRIHCAVNVDTTGGERGLSWRAEEITETVTRFRELAKTVGCTEPLTPETLLRVVLALQSSSSLPPAETVEPMVLQAMGEAITQLAAMRAREGEALSNDLIERLGLLQTCLTSIKDAATGRVENYRDLLHARLKQAGLQLELEDERVLKEIAIFADRCDITEEQTRLASHLAQFGETLAVADPQGVGRKLEFILQEINREYNTIGAKANQLEISKYVIDAKNEIERLREQIQNVE